MDHNEDDLGVQSPEQIPLPDSEDELGATSSTVADNIQPAEEGVGTNRPKRVKKPSHTVIENKLVEIENQLEIQWKKCLDQIEIVQSPEQSVEEIRNGIKEARSLFRAYWLTLLSVQELTASVKSSEIIDERKQLEETTAKCKEFLDSVIKDSDEQIKSLLLEAQSTRSSTTGSINSVTSTRQGESRCRSKKGRVA